ncbi:MAG: hypothetical protein WDO16_09015 [Bacteroidota bacterium]
MRVFKIAILVTVLSSRLFGQNPVWVETKINEILTLKLSPKHERSNSVNIKSYGGYVNSDYVGFQFYDTVYSKINTERRFQIALTGFVNGRLSDTTLRNYTASIIDTALGKTRGIMVKFKAINSSEQYKRIYYYVTIANDNYYWFFAYCQCDNENDIDSKSFFDSINFDKEKVKENSFALASIYLTK